MGIQKCATYDTQFTSIKSETNQENEKRKDTAALSFEKTNKETNKKKTGAFITSTQTHSTGEKNQP